MAERHVSGARLSAFLDDELDDDLATALTRHVVACPRCEAELEGLRAMRAALRRLPALQAPVLAASASPPGRRSSLARRMRLAAAAVVGPAVLLVALYAAGGDRAGDVVPPTERFVVEHVARAGGGPVPTPVVAPPGRRP